MAAPLAARPAPAAPAPTGRLLVPADGVITAQLNGVALRLLAAPDGPLTPTLAPGLAVRAGLDGGLFGNSAPAIRAAVGPQSIFGHTSLARLALGEAAHPPRQQVQWFDRAIVAGADAEAGPAALGAAQVVFALASPRGNEVVHRLPLVSDHGVQGTLMRVNGQAIMVTFAPQRARSVATAAAAQAIAAAQGGLLTGATSQAPLPFGITRPARQMALARPLAVPGGALARLDVRVADYGSAQGIADADAPADAADPGEIIVSAPGASPPLYRLTLGRDALAGCSSLTFDEAQGVVLLACRPAGAV